MVLIDRSFAFGSGMGDGRTAQRKYVILHDTGNATNNSTDSAYREASYMFRNWQNANTTYVVGWDRAYVLSAPGYVSWGAGNANPYAPVQLELSHYADKTKAMQAYRNWVELAVQSAKDYGIPVNLDQGVSGTAGIKTHKWVSDNIWGDHQDPYGYLTEIGVSKSQLAVDLANGTSSVAAPDPNIVTVVYSGHGGVRLLNAKGQWLSRWLDPGTRWRAYGTAVIRNEEMVLLGGDQYVPMRYTDWAGDVAQIIYPGPGGVGLLNSKGKYIGKYVQPETRWKTFGVAVIRGQVMYSLGGDQYIPKIYVHLTK